MTPEEIEAQLNKEADEKEEAILERARERDYEKKEKIQ